MIHSLNILKEISATRKPSIGIKATPLNADLESPWESKFGGGSFLPKGIDHPKNNKGDYLSFLAQLNFADMPKLDGFPHEGVLQFYSHLYG